MTAELLFSVVLCALILGLAGFVCGARDHFAATVGFVAVGLVLALAWMVLSAPDVAMTEAALGGGVMGALLLVAERRLRGANEDATPGPGFRRFAFLLCGLVSAALVMVVVLLPSPAPSLAPATAAMLPDTGLQNPVTAVLMAFRALDTMLEKVVLLLALTAVWSLAANRDWNGPAGGRVTPATGPQRFLARAVIPFGLVIGAFLFWVGADAPGGAFAGGAVISAMLLLAVLSGEHRGPRVTNASLRIIVCLGVLLFLLTGLAALAAGQPFLSYPSEWAKPVIVVLEIAMTISIGATLAMLVLGPPQRSASE